MTQAVLWLPFTHLSCMISGRPVNHQSGLSAKYFIMKIYACLGFVFLAMGKSLRGITELEEKLDPTLHI